MKEKILEALAKYSKNGSGWIVTSVEKIQIDRATLEPATVSSYIPLPKTLENRKALINMKNTDNRCFKWAATRALNPVSVHAERITKELKQQASKLNWNRIEFPTPCTEQQLKTFEKNNGVGISVYGADEKDRVYPLFVSRAEKTINLFFQKTEVNSKEDIVVETPCTEQQLKTFEKNNNITITVVHENGSPIYIPAPSKNIKNIFLCYENDQYYPILKIGRLVGKNISKNQHKKYVCPFCLNAFGNEDLLLKHEKYCREHDCVNTVFPEPGKNTVKLKNFTQISRASSNRCPPQKARQNSTKGTFRLPFAFTLSLEFRVLRWNP